MTCYKLCNCPDTCINNNLHGQIIKDFGQPDFDLKTATTLLHLAMPVT